MFGRKTKDRANAAQDDALLAQRWCIELLERVKKLEEDRRDDTVLLLVLYEALYAAVSDPGQPFTAFTKAREILTMLGE